GGRIEVLPLPGHAGAQRSWQVPTGQADLVTGLSWAPDGRHLSYMAGQGASTGTADSPMTMDTAVSALPPPAPSYWERAMNTGITCVPVAMAWLGRSGRYATLEECASTGTVVLQTSASTGAAFGQPLVVAHQMGCEPAALDPNASGDRILISYCGVYLHAHAKLTSASRAPTPAALRGWARPTRSRPGPDPPMSRRVRSQRAQEVDFPEGWPVRVAEVELRVRALPEQEAAKPLLP